jgi:predicted metal-dependent peptidase
MARAKEPAVIEAMSVMINQHPFFAVLLMDLMELVETEAIAEGVPNPTAATNGKKLFVNPKWMAKLSVQERVGVLAHEITHVIMQHPERMRGYGNLGFGPDLKPFSAGKFNHACDYIINSYLIEQGFQLPLGTLQNSQITKADIADEVYLKLPDDEDEKDDGWDQHIPGDPADMPDKATIQRALKGAANAAKAQGKMPGGMDRFIDELCEHQVTWQEYLRKLIVSSYGKDQATWTRPNRKKLALPPHVYWPGRNGTRSGEFVVEIDTSGSISEKELKLFLSELHGILTDMEPEKIHVMYVDAKLHGDVHEIDDPNELLELGKKAGGGGGTDMTVVFREMEERSIDAEAVIVFTDGYTGFGEEQPVNTIWCITTPNIVAPWGTTVHVDLKK